MLTSSCGIESFTSVAPAWASMILVFATSRGAGCRIGWGLLPRFKQRLMIICGLLAAELAEDWFHLGYEELLTNFNMPTLADRRLQLKLCTMYKIIHGLTYFPSVFVPRNTRTHIDSPLFIQPFARTNSYLYSFIPHSISLWNSLPSNITTACSVSVFRTLLTRSL